MNPPRHWPLDPRRRQAPRPRPGRFAGRRTPMTRTTTSRPRMAATYAPGTVRARRWHGEGDVRGYRPPSGWTARADLTDIHPITGRALPRAVWWLIETKETPSSGSPRHIPPGASGTPKSGRGGGRARFQRPKPKSPRSPPSARRRRGERATALRARNPCGSCRRRTSKRCGAYPARRDGFDGAPPRWAGLVGLRPGLLRQVVRKRAVLDAGDSLPVHHEGRFTDSRPASLWSFHATPQACCRNLRQGRPCLVVGALTWPASGRAPVQPSRGDAEPALSPFGAGSTQGVLVSL
jgi:hypothetical protein